MQRIRNTIAGFTGALTVLGANVAQADVTGGGWHHGMMGGGGWFFGPIMMVVFFALLIGAVMIIARMIGPNRHAGDGGEPVDRALGILRERFAKGEITKEEFEEARKTLE